LGFFLFFCKAKNHPVKGILPQIFFYISRAFVTRSFDNTSPHLPTPGGISFDGTLGVGAGGGRAIKKERRKRGNERKS
jgi:hypothetical protein